MGIKKKILFLCVMTYCCEAQSKVCHYKATVWNTRLKKVVNIVKVEKDYSKLKPAETGSFGCTPCLVDQTEIKLPFLPPFKLCKYIAPKIEKLLIQIHEEGFPLNTVIGYRPGLSKGPADSEGNRTELSNHSFGIAIDINPEFNGLYDNCKTWNSKCRLVKGGSRKLISPGTIKKNSPLVFLMRDIGLKWGGEIAGNQKDFMHFSPSGY